jgi:heat shock protein HtpX
MGNVKVLVLLAGLVALFGAMVIRFAISRTREYKADAAGAEISGQPLALASALGKLQTAAQRIPIGVSPAMAPLAAFQGGLATLFATHPPVEERVRRLQALARGAVPRG